uniref:MARVEL domain-containing protein n=2 Tax=Steinernema glaseri TaxID=37863 RepID=A0A1I7YYC0_9BILA
MVGMDIYRLSSFRHTSAQLKMVLPRDALIHPQYYVFFGRLHAEKAIFIITILKVISEIMEFLLALAVSSSFDSMLEVIHEGIGLLEIISLVLAYKHKNHHLLIPAILHQMFLTILLVMIYCLTAAVMFLPLQNLKDLFGHHTSTSFELLTIIATGLMTAWYGFCTFSAMACYKYYEDRHILPTRTEDNVNERMTFTDDQEPSTSATAISFENPNYFVHSSDDHRESINESRGTQPSPANDSRRLLV